MRRRSAAVSAPGPADGRQGGCGGGLGWAHQLDAAPPSMPLNAEIGSHRRYDYRDLELAWVDAAKRHYEATVNDVVLAIATSALRSWLLDRSVRTEGLQLRALAPSTSAQSTSAACGVTASGCCGRRPRCTPKSLSSNCC